MTHKLDIPPGNMQDQNSDQYLKRVEVTFGEVASVLRGLLYSPESESA